MTDSLEKQYVFILRNGKNDWGKKLERERRTTKMKARSGLILQTLPN
jgi:hypothetical protein